MTESVYKIHNNKTPGVYIGCSKDPYKRFAKHQSSLRHHRHTSAKFQELYNENSDELVLRLEIVGTYEDDTIAREQELAIMKDEPCLLNSKLHAEGGDKVSNHPNNAQYRDKQKELAKKNVNFLNQETRPGALNPNYRNGRYVRGRSCPNCGNSIGYGSNVCKDCRDKTGEANPFYGKKHTEETKRRLSEKRIGFVNERDRKPISVDGVVYASLALASKELNIPAPTLSYRAHRDSYPNVFYIDKE